MQRSKKAYDKAFKEAEKAAEHFQRADADLNLSRAEVEHKRTTMSYKSQMCEAAKNDYADQLQRTNDLQRSHYRSGMPDVYRQLQELDEKRIKNIKNFIHSSVDIERNVFPIINTCLDGIVRAGDLINEKEVIRSFILQNVSCFDVYLIAGYSNGYRTIQVRFLAAG